jgi:hypothetical protein
VLTGERWRHEHNHAWLTYLYLGVIWYSISELKCRCLGREILFINLQAVAYKDNILLYNPKTSVWTQIFLYVRFGKILKWKSVAQLCCSKCKLVKRIEASSGPLYCRLLYDGWCVTQRFVNCLMAVTRHLLTIAWRFMTQYVLKRPLN